jgi:hypothetical protein
MGNRSWKGLCVSMWVLAMALAAGVNAQNRVHFGIGFNQSYAQLDSLNYVLNAFNAANPWTAAKPMHEIHAPAGLTAHLGADFAGVLVDFQYTMRFASTRARGEVYPGSATTQVSQVHYNASTMDLGLGIFVLRKSRFRLALGQSADFGNLRLSGRQGIQPQVQSQIFGRYVNELNFGTTSFLHFMISFRDGVSPGIFIRPYYQLSLLKNDYAPLNRVLRPQASLSDPLFILGRQSNVGIKVGVFLGS